jgi:hypothetical protein
LGCLGFFFYNCLGWDKVFVLGKPPDKGYPTFEWTSDLAGVVFDEIDSAGKCKAELAKRLTEAGFVLMAPPAGE